MNIIEAREAALAGKTVISPSGLELVADDFDDMKTVSHDMVFGEWKSEPVVFETEVISCGSGAVIHTDLTSLIGKKVRVTVEVVE